MGKKVKIYTLNDKVPFGKLKHKDITFLELIHDYDPDYIMSYIHNNKRYKIGDDIYKKLTEEWEDYHIDENGVFHPEPDELWNF